MSALNHEEETLAAAQRNGLNVVSFPGDARVVSDRNRLPGGVAEGVGDVTGRSRWQVIQADATEPSEWPGAGVVCRELSHYRIAHLGMADVRQPSRFVRTRSPGALFIACFGGKGQILVNNRWRSCGEGTAGLLPQGTLSALRSIPRTPWQFCWINYRPSPETTPFNPLDMPVVERFDCETFRLIIAGLCHACAQATVPSAIHHWLELIETYTQSFGRAWQKDERFLKLWTEVQNNLHLPWTGDQLANRSHMCFEHLRRLCQRQLGRSPMHQVTFLRMRRAAELLISTGDKIETIAAAVGYSNSFAFSVAFKRWTSWPPSEFRRKNQERQEISHAG